jgi:hypothetical protein
MSKYGELIHVRSLSPTIRLSAASGLVWALIAWFIGYRAFGDRIWGGIIIAPLIGILIGRLSWPMRNKPRWVQIAGSLFDLYVAASCFAIGMALFSAVLGPRSVKFSAAPIELVLAVLWGLTFGGYALVLWPLSFFNHRLVWQADAGRFPAPPEVRITSPAIRSLAVRVMALAVVGYAAWTLVQAVGTTLGSPASTMPWWFATGLMGWSKWFVLGVFVWLSAPVLAAGATLAAGSEERSTATYSELIGVTGFAVFVFAMLAFAATMVVAATKVSLVQSWATEGTVFWAPSYYANVFSRVLTLVPRGRRDDGREAIDGRVSAVRRGLLLATLRRGGASALEQPCEFVDKRAAPRSGLKCQS